MRDLGRRTRGESSRGIAHLLVAGLLAMALAVLVPVVVATGKAPDPSQEAEAFKDAPPTVGLPPKSKPGLAKGPEITKLRTRTSRTFAGPGGTKVAQMFAVPVNYKNSQGDWKKIDTGLSADGAGAGYAAKSGANSWSVQLPDDLGAQPVKVTDGSAWTTFKLRDAVGAPKIDGNKSRYANVADEVDAEFSVHPDALKEDLVLASKQAPASYTYDLAASEGLNAKIDKQGGVEFRDRKGETTFVIAPPVVNDAKQAAGKAAYELKRTADGWALEVRIDKKWLGAQDRAFPVRLDPTFYFSGITEREDRTPQMDCAYSAAAPNNNYCTGNPLWVGNAGSGNIHRSVLKFDVAGAIPDRQADVLDANLSVYLDTRQNAGNMDVNLHEVTSAWDNGATWNKRNATTNWGAAGGDFAATRADYSKDFGYKGNGQTHYFTPNELVQGWVDGSKTNNGLLLRTAESATQLFTLRSTDSVDQSKWPQLSVGYEARVGSRRQYSFESQTLTDRSNLKVNVASGNALFQAQDINIAGTGLPLQVTRSFNSRSDRWADVSHNWTLNFGSGMGIQRKNSFTRGESAVIYGPTGEPMLFQRDTPGGAFKTPSGVDAVLTENATTHKFELKFNKTDEVWRFDDKGWLYERADRNGNKLTYAIDNDGILTKITDTQGRDVTFSHNGDGYITGATDWSGRTWTYNVSGGQLYGYTDPEGKSTSYAYDANLNLNEITDPRGNKTKIAYDSSHRVTSVKRVTNTGANTGPTTSFVYSAADSSCPSTSTAKTVVTDPRSKNTTYCLDKQGRTDQVTDARGNKQSSTYTSNSDVLTATNQSKTTQLGYNTDFMPNSVKQPAGEETTATYKTGADKYRLDTVTQPQGTGNQFAWTSFGNMMSVTDAQSPGSGVQAKLEYNGQTEAGVCPNNPSTKPGTLRCAIDGNSRQTRYSYDNAGNLIKITPPATTGPGTAILGETTITNDSLSRVKTVTDGKAQVKTYTYDKLDRTKKIEYSNGTSISYTYDENGNQTQRNDSVHGITGYSYDKLNRRDGETYPSSVTNSYGYDDAGNLTSVTDAGGTVSYGYDDANNNTSLTEPGSLTTTFGFDDRDNRTSKTLPNGVVETITVDDSDKPAVIEAKKGATTLTRFAYDYDVAGSPVKKTAQKQSVTDKDANKTFYGYDSADRLKTAVTKANNGAGATLDDRLWEYDLASNRNKATLNGVVTSYAYNEANQLCWTKNGTSTAGCGSPPSGAVPYRYDANGNETQGTAGRTATYNIRDQLASITNSGTTTNFGYAGPNQSERTSNGGVGQRNNLLGLSGQGGSYWTRDSGGGLIGQRNSSPRYYLQDGLGSVRALTDSTGAVTDTYKTDPFGVSMGSTGSTWNPWNFAGEYREFASGSYIYKIGARNYDQTLGRWTQQDPLDQPSDLANANRYLYVAGNPVNLTDPTGLKAACNPQGKGRAGTPATSCNNSPGSGPSNNGRARITCKATYGFIGAYAGKAPGVVAGILAGETCPD